MGGENEVIALHGAPRLKEHAIVHKPSRTLIVAHLVFNFRADERGWNRFFHRDIAGFKRYLGMSRIFRLCISDRSAFRASLEKIWRPTSTGSLSVMAKSLRRTAKLFFAGH
jgi:hypothetical protein